MLRAYPAFSTRTLQAMHQNQLTMRIAAGMLSMDQHLHPWLGLIVNGLYRPSRLAVRAGPEISGEGGEMRVPEKGMEGPQIVILLRASATGALSEDPLPHGRGSETPNSEPRASATGFRDIEAV